MSLEALKEKLREKATGRIAEKLIEKIDELIGEQKKTNELLGKIYDLIRSKSG